MLKKIYCPICNSEIVLRYFTPAKNFRIEKGKIIRDDVHTGHFFDDPELNFECSNDKSHNIHGNHIHYNINDEWEDTIREEFYRSKYYDD